MARKRTQDAETSTVVAESYEPMTGQEIASELRRTGTGQGRIQKVEWFLAKNPEASGKDVLEYVEQLGWDSAHSGTYRKIYEYVYGPGAVPERLLADHPSEEIKNLRKQVEIQKTQINNLTMQLHGEQGKRRYAEERMRSMELVLKRESLEFTERSDDWISNSDPVSEVH